MAEHKLKCWINYYEAIERGDKTFEVRRDDRGFQKGDTLILRKYDPAKMGYVTSGYGYNAVVVELRRRISYVLSGGQFGIEPGFVVMALTPETEESQQ